MLADAFALLQRARPSYVALALGVYALSVPLVAFRWQTVLQGVRRGAPRISLWPLVLASLAASFVNNVTPAARVSGEACRVITLARLKLASIGQAAASVAYERLSEVPAVAVLALVALRIAGRATAPWAMPAVVVALLLVPVARRALSRVWQQLRARWTALETLAVRPSALVASMLLSGGIWTLDVVRLRLVGAAFDARIGMTQAAALAMVTIVAGWVPTIGGLGAIEAGLVAGLIAFGVPAPQAIAIAAVERTISYGIATVAGFGALSLLGGRSLWSAIRSRGAVEGATA